MKWSCDSRPGERFAGVVSLLLSLTLGGVGLGWGQMNSFGDVGPLYFTNAAVSSLVLDLRWNPSQDPTAVGYLLCWGWASGQCTNQLDAGNVTNAILGGFAANTAYFFTVVVYDDLGEQSDPSNEVQYPVASALPAGTPKLGIQTAVSGTSSTSICLNFQGNGGSTYAILATQDFLHWDTVWTTNCLSSGVIAFPIADVTNYPCRFYRVVQQQF